MNSARLTIALGLAVLTAACDKQAETPVAADASQAVTTAPIMAKGHGTVTAIDNAAGTITLDHDPIPEAKWPAMTMAFKAAPAIRDATKVGDKVDFDLTLTGSAGEVTAIAKQP